jgi:glucose-6-phosphate isomerase
VIESRLEGSHAQANSAPGLLIQLDAAGCLAGQIGAHGLSPSTYAVHLEHAGGALAQLRAAYQDGKLSLLAQCSRHDDLDGARAALDRLSTGARTLIFFGSGSVCIAAEALAQLAGWNIPGAADLAQKQRPRTRFYDNLDPVTLQRMLSGLDLAATRFIFSSPSGRDSQTLAQAMVTIAATQTAGLTQRLPDLVLGLSQPARSDTHNPLRALFAVHGIPLLDLPTDAEGPFAILSSAALLPAMARGLDAHALRRSANDTLMSALSCASADICLPAKAAAAVFGLATEHHIRTHLIMPFSDRLEKLAAWMANIWLAGTGRHHLAPMPFTALGPRDCANLLPHLQHGRRDHLTTLLHVPVSGAGNPIEADLARQAGTEDLAGCTVGDIVASQSQAMADRLIAAGRPVRSLYIADLNERVIGALIMHVMLETLLFAQLADASTLNRTASSQTGGCAAPAMDR